MFKQALILWKMCWWILMCVENKSAPTATWVFTCVILSTLHIVKSIYLHMHTTQRDVFIILLNAYAYLFILSCSTQEAAGKKNTKKLRLLLSHVRVCCVELYENVKPALLVRQEWLWATWQAHLKASMSLSTFCASPCTRTWAWNFLKASSSSMPEKSISSTTQL